ncbi:MAG: hypothetical protein IKI93_02930 [Clostridia bacterium]|nr:hypothetical protein [Clostridia bacterium]
MKKYVKPELIFESFEMTQQVAACDFDHNNTLTDSGCKFDGVDSDTGFGGTVFLNKENGCTVTDQSYCYHTGSGLDLKLFNS